MNGRRGDWVRGRLQKYYQEFTPSPLPPLSHSSIDQCKNNPLFN